jgi:hypothetical protein
MTPGAIRVLRAWFKFDRFLEPDNPEELFDALMKVAKWRVEQGVEIKRDLDGTISEPIEDSLARFGLITHLATIDGVFFEMARRMMARQLIRSPAPDELVRHLAAALLDPGEIPASDKPQLARDVAVIMALCVGQGAGWPPTQNRERANEGVTSGAARAVALLPKLTLLSVEGIWTNRRPRLVQASFDEAAVSDFLPRVSRTT